MNLIDNEGGNTKFKFVGIDDDIEIKDDEELNIKSIHVRKSTDRKII